MCFVSPDTAFGKVARSVGGSVLLAPQTPDLPKPPPPAPPSPTKTATRLRRPAAIRASQARGRLGTAQLRVPLRSVNIPQ